jgi:hypothetical protein
MSSPAGWHEHRPVEIDESTSNALIDGCLSPIDTPAGYEEVAQLIEVIRRGLESQESCGEPPAVAAMVQQIGTRPSIVCLPTQGRRRRKKRSAVAAAVVGVLVSAGTAAAATGALPGAIQAAVHDVAAHMGISIPGPGGSAKNRRTTAAPGGALASAAQLSTAFPFDFTSDSSTSAPPPVPPAAGALLSGARLRSIDSTPGGRGSGSSGPGSREKASGTAHPAQSQAGATPHRGTGSQKPPGRQVGSSGTGPRTTGRRHVAPGTRRPPAPRSKPRPPASTSPARHPKIRSPIPPRSHGHGRRPTKPHHITNAHRDRSTLRG